MDPLLRLSQALEAHETVVLVTIVRAPRDRDEWVSRKLLLGPDGIVAGCWSGHELEGAAIGGARLALQEQRPRLVAHRTPAGDFALYCEPYIPRPALLLVGGGHIAQQVAGMASQAGFRVAVVDDRMAYANRERFPDADEVICADMPLAVRATALEPTHSVVLVTRGHRHDMACLLEVIGRPARYVGMIGSRTRVETIFGLLASEHGVSPTELARVHAPIGLDIGAESPYEIAVSVVAELIKARRGGTGASLSQLNRRLNREARPLEIAGGVRRGS
ncbi:MAG TPA: XdhC/CoxI family protein [Symbiobacteriaceae bacterium]|nr:XdhC/CoxI family protein [Symbiobacteriaceae bacterium]